ncbi:MAG TPA: hypothetical protein VHZ98_03805 [Galbitalea sp.]|jgi:hypothetical protein|nr:hypothetical protein [Galbitalea sp.]
MAWDWAAIGAWILKFGVIVIAPLAGILGTLLGANIANRSALRRWKAEQQESRLSIARKAAIEVAESSYQWASAQFGYGRLQLGIGTDNAPTSESYSEMVGAAQTRQVIAFATLYVSVSHKATVDAARELEEKRKPLIAFLGDDAAGVLNNTGEARNRALVRLIQGWSEFDTAIRDYIEAIAPLLAPVPEP